MSQTKYKWDIEGLEAQLGALRRELEQLREEKEFLRSLTQEVQQNWQSIAGDAYKGKLDVDLENYEIILQGMERRCQMLDKIIHSIYEECEKNVETWVGRLQGSIQII